MRIKVALLDVDKNYLQRITVALAKDYVEKIELFAYSKAEDALESIERKKIDVLLCSSEIDFDFSLLPRNCGFAFLVRSLDIESYKGQKTVCKFQRVDMIYKAVMELYADSVSDDIVIRYSGNQQTNFYLFSSFCGGAGASTVAAAFAKRCAQGNSKVLYINLDCFGEAESYFSGEGQYNFGDVLFALKSNKTNIHLKLEGYTRRDDSGVHYFASTESALDMMDITVEDIQKLLTTISEVGLFNIVVIDATFALNKEFFALADFAEKVVLVSDGSKISNNKFQRVYNALDVLEQQEKCRIIPKISVIYNKFRSKSNKVISNNSIQVLGGIPKIEVASAEQIVLHIAGNDTLDKLLS